MGTRRRSTASLAALVIYVAAMIGGGLHHHAAHPCNSHASLPSYPDLDNESSASLCDGDSHDCALCLAIQQAKTQPPPPVVVTSSTLVGEADIDCSSLPRTCFHISTHARAPPSL